MNGIDDEFYSTPDLEEGSVKRAIIENAKDLYPSGWFENWGDILCQSGSYQASNDYHQSKWTATIKGFKRKNGGYRGRFIQLHWNPAIDYIVRLNM